MEVKAKILAKEFKAEDGRNLPYYPVSISIKGEIIPLKVSEEDKTFYNYLLNQHFKTDGNNELEVKGTLNDGTVFIQIADESFYLVVGDNYKRLLNFLTRGVK